MSAAFKMYFSDMPESISIHSEFQHKKVELILLTEEENHLAMEWETKFFENTFGCITE